MWQLPRVGLVFSTADEAGRGIASVLRTLVGGREVGLRGGLRGYLIDGLDAVLVGFSEGVTELEFLDDVLGADYYVVISKHWSAQRIRSLTVHHVGIPVHDLSLCRSLERFPPSNPPVAKLLLINLHRLRGELGLNGFTVTYEVTHHGPLGVRRPLTFVELGSSASEWALREAQEAVARAVLNTLGSSIDCLSSAGIGGNHYASLFTYRALSSEECYGHIVPSYVLKQFKEDVEVLRKLIDYAVSHTTVRTSRIVVDDKVQSTAKRLARELGSRLGIEVVTA